RDLPQDPAASEIRRDPLTGEWVAMATHRQTRTYKPPADLCPLCPSAPGKPSEVPESDYDVVVFENRFPSFAQGVPDTPPATIEEAGIVPVAPGKGRCEVVCFTSDHGGSFGQLSPTRVRTVVDAWADRTAALSVTDGVRQVFPFENRGEQIGVTLSHPHGQIYGYPYVTPRTQRLIASIDAIGPELFQRILATEQASERVVLRGEHWTAFVPFAARWPIEVHMLPHRQVTDFAATNGAERDELATLYLRLLRGIDNIYDTPTPYIAAWHQAPVSHPARDDIRLMLQVTSPRRAADKLKYLAGSEAAMGAWIGDVAPEHSAELVRDGIARL